MSEVNLTSKNYSEEVEKATIPVLIHCVKQYH